MWIRRDLDVKGQNNLVRVEEIVAVVMTEVTANQRLVRGDQINHIAAIERPERQPGDLVDISYDLFNTHIPGWRGPAQIATVNEGEGNAAARPQGKTLDRRQQEVRARVPYLIYLSVVLGHGIHQWKVGRREAESMST